MSWYSAAREASMTRERPLGPIGAADAGEIVDATRGAGVAPGCHLPCMSRTSL